MEKTNTGIIQCNIPVLPPLSKSAHPKVKIIHWASN
jgi:hypothetical protein